MSEYTLRELFFNLYFILFLFFFPLKCAIFIMSTCLHHKYIGRNKTKIISRFTIHKWKVMINRNKTSKWSQSFRNISVGQKSIKLKTKSTTHLYEVVTHNIAKIPSHITIPNEILFLIETYVDVIAFNNMHSLLSQLIAGNGP